MALSLEITYRDGKREEVNIYSSDFVRWERESRRQGWGAITDSPILANTYLAWAGLFRSGKTTASFEDWLDLVDTVGQGSDAPTEESSEGAESPF